MGICSSILHGLLNSCESNQGGISEVWIASLDFPLQIEVGDGVITYIGDGSSIPFNPFVKYNFKKGNASMQTKVSIDASTNNKHYDTTLTVTFPKVETVKLLEVDNLLESNNLAAIVGDNNGYYWFLGKDYPMTVTSVDDSWGSNRKDANNIKVTFNCPSKIRPMQTLYLPWEHRPKPPHPIIVDYEVSVFGTKNSDITVTSDWFKDDKLFTEDDYYEVGSIVTVSYKGSENFLGWYDGKTNEFQSQYREYTFRMPKKDVVLVGLLKTITPPPPPTPHVRYKYEGEWYTDEFGDGIIPNQEYQEMDGLTDVVISNGVTSIGDKAFYFCGNLTNVTIPTTVININERAFYYCSNIMNITYNGTSHEFASINHSTYAWFAVSDDTIVHCTDGDYNLGELIN